MLNSLPFWFKQITCLEIILAGLALGLALVAAGLGLAIIYPQSGFEGESAPPEVAAPLPATATATPEPTATPRLAPTVSPQPSDPPVPTTVPTQVIDPGLINETKIDEVTAFVEQWRGLALPQAMPLDFLTRRQLQSQWREKAFDQTIIQTIQTRQEFYTALGLIEPGVDLVQVVLEAQTGFVLGYYSPEEKKMYIVAESVNMFAREEMTFAHEYTHALQDYHFDLSGLVPPDSSGDAALAARALPEGDARLVEQLFTRQNINQDELDYNVYRYLFEAPPEFEGVSPALGTLTYFPYTAGEYFVRYLFIQGNHSWDLVNQAYRSPPISSEQVMHPEKYLAGERPVAVVLPDLAPGLDETWREIDRDVLGEIGLLVWLLDQVDPPTAISGAAGWEGDAYTLWVDDADQRLLMVQSVWESAAEAGEFFNAFVDYMELRADQQSLSEETVLRSWWSPAGVILLQRRGQQNLIIIAPDVETVNSVRGQLGSW